MGKRAAQGNLRSRLVALRHRAQPPHPRISNPLHERARTVKKATESRGHICAELFGRIQAVELTMEIEDGASIHSPSAIFHPLSSMLMRLNRNALRLIRAARIAHLATADKSGQPHVIPICFAFDGKYFYSPIDEKPKRVSPRQLKRARNIEANPNVSLVIDRYDENWQKLAYVLVSGIARIIFRSQRHGTAVSLLRKKYR